MPHLTIEYTNNLSLRGDPAALIHFNELLVASGHFEEADIKTRTIRLDSFAIGTSPKLRAFAHIKLAILTGRTTATRSTLSKLLLEASPKLFDAPPDVEVQFCVEVLEIDGTSYTKATINA